MNTACVATGRLRPGLGCCIEYRVQGTEYRVLSTPCSAQARVEPGTRGTVRDAAKNRRGRAKTRNGGTRKKPGAGCLLTQHEKIARGALIPGKPDSVNAGLWYCREKTKVERRIVPLKRDNARRQIRVFFAFNVVYLRIFGFFRVLFRDFFAFFSAFLLRFFCNFSRYSSVFHEFSRVVHFLQMCATKFLGAPILSCPSVVPARLRRMRRHR